jgi:hypothetical protein
MEIFRTNLLPSIKALAKWDAQGLPFRTLHDLLTHCQRCEITEATKSRNQAFDRNKFQGYRQKQPARNFFYINGDTQGER